MPIIIGVQACHLDQTFARITPIPTRIAPTPITVQEMPYAAPTWPVHRSTRLVDRPLDQLYDRDRRERLARADEGKSPVSKGQHGHPSDAVKRRVHTWEPP